jgi:hypothetical protein
MHQQLWGYEVEWKSVSRGTGGGGKVEYHWYNECFNSYRRLRWENKDMNGDCCGEFEGPNYHDTPLETEENIGKLHTSQIKRKSEPG